MTRTFAGIFFARFVSAMRSNLTMSWTSCCRSIGEVLTKPIDRQQLVQLMVRFDLMADTKRAKKMPANVLVIDDDLQAISLVKAVLKPFNVRVSAVDSARTGIEQALRNKPDLVILDLVLKRGERRKRAA